MLEKYTWENSAIIRIHKMHWFFAWTYTWPEAEVKCIQDEEVLDCERAIVEVMNSFEIPLNFWNIPLDFVHHLLNFCRKKKQPQVKSNNYYWEFHEESYYKIIEPKKYCTIQKLRTAHRCVPDINILCPAYFQNKLLNSNQTTRNWQVEKYEWKRIIKLAIETYSQHK